MIKFGRYRKSKHSEFSPFSLVTDKEFVRKKFGEKDVLDLFGGYSVGLNEEGGLVVSEDCDIELGGLTLENLDLLFEETKADFEAYRTVWFFTEGKATEFKEQHRIPDRIFDSEAHGFLSELPYNLILD